MIIYILLTMLAGIIAGLYFAVRTKKGVDVVYNSLDKVGLITNILLIPVYISISPLYLFLGVISYPEYDGFLGVLGWIVAVIIASAGPFCPLGLGASVALRKKGKSKLSFIVQFAGLAAVGVSVLLFVIFYGNLLSSIN